MKKLIVFFLALFSLISCIDDIEYENCYIIPEIKIVNDWVIPVGYKMSVLDTGQIFDIDNWYDQKWISCVRYAILEPGDSVNIFLEEYKDSRTIKINIRALIDTIPPICYTPGVWKFITSNDCETKEYYTTDPDINGYFIMIE